MKQIRFLTLSEILLIAQNQINLYGGAFGLRDRSLLSSALSMPESTFQGDYLHKTIYDKAAAYIFHLTQNHPFVDGSKRVGLAAGLVFLDLNGIRIEDPDTVLYPLMMKVASWKATKEKIAETLRELARGKNG